MEINIEHKPTYTIINLTGDLLNLTAAESLKSEIAALKEQGMLTFIVNLKNVEQMDMEAGNVLMELHEATYDAEGSLVFAELKDDVHQMMKKGQLHLSLNLCPTMIEAIDIISMELLERDLLNE